MMEDQEHITQEMIDWYIAYWCKVLHGLLGWSNDKTRQWAVRYQEYMSTSWWFYHDSPGSYLADLFIPQDFQGPSRVEMRHEITALIEGHGAEYMQVDRDYSIVRLRIQELLQSNGLEMPDADRQ